MRILITGGAGFVGSNLARKFRKELPNCEVIVFDNLSRRGSELNLLSFKELNIAFHHGDVRNAEDFNSIMDIDLIIDASAEPSILAGLDSIPSKVVNINLLGTVNILNFALRNSAAFIFLSTSRVYSIDALNAINFKEEDARFVISEDQIMRGVSSSGISESFEVMGPRSLYGATKLASELLIHEYTRFYGLKAIINRCGVLAGPGQFGKVDQGVMVLWVARHYWRKPLAYFGYGGEGKQLRDVLHIDDLFDLIEKQIDSIEKLNGMTFNVGGGFTSCISLCELTQLCRTVVGNNIQIDRQLEDRIADIRIYVGDNSQIQQKVDWRVKYKPLDIVSDIFSWIKENEGKLAPIINN